MTDDHEPPYSVKAERIVDDDGLTDGEATRQLLGLGIDILEQIMMTLWAIEDAVVPPVDKDGKRKLDS